MSFFNSICLCTSPLVEIPWGKLKEEGNKCSLCSQTYASSRISHRNWFNLRSIRTELHDSSFLIPQSLIFSSNSDLSRLNMSTISANAFDKLLRARSEPGNRDPIFFRYLPTSVKSNSPFAYTLSISCWSQSALTELLNSNF
uniref:Uncharacterized protein n=1 Tax=Opuntia streptacantha TaxID=393608 RepID=A0A7C9DZW8_OPUST